MKASAVRKDWFNKIAKRVWRIISLPFKLTFVGVNLAMLFAALLLGFPILGALAALWLVAPIMEPVFPPQIVGNQLFAYAVTGATLAAIFGPVLWATRNYEH